MPVHAVGEAQISEKYESIKPYLNEKTRRIWAATEARAMGRGGVSEVARATGLSRTTLYKAIAELEQPIEERMEIDPSAIRQTGGGRKLLSDTDLQLLEDLQELMSATTRGDPQSPLLWTTKSTIHLAEELQAMGHRVSQTSVWRLLNAMDYSLQVNRKVHEGEDHPQRDEQFLHIAKRVKQFEQQQQPVISVDAKKKELLGEYRNQGQEWQAQGNPIAVQVYDFVDKQRGKALPYGIYDLLLNQGWVSVGIDHDTAQFAVESIRRWWYEMGLPLYPNARQLLITADCGGSNGYRVRLWKLELQRLADETGLDIEVCHFPPGTSKWNKSEHQMFCHISQNWRGRPLTSRQVVINLINHTQTKQGLHIQAKLDKHHYKTKIKVTDDEFEAISLERDPFHGEWNYRIKSRE
ncbi:MAG: ISAzo13 family transposase [Oscillatoriophycideae cyanobacterium NC_groundwater_1537_Pr4_S-0.65um_50_18]|nr:ISAzo13 family transposase [Oscillatoriophycideae cyanobacterium NC_groundwater_1537_Pr4_S-0.65um_50_18]